MRDLKHLIFMEDLLQEANNDLVKQAKAEGRRAAARRTWPPTTCPPGPVTSAAA